MTVQSALLEAAIGAVVTALVINFWVKKFSGSDMEFRAMSIVFLISAIAIFCILFFASSQIATIAICVGIGILVLTLIANFLSRP